MNKNSATWLGDEQDARQNSFLLPFTNFLCYN